MIFDNSEHPSTLIADGFKNDNMNVYEPEIYNQMMTP
jgi:hypothetical protein